MNRLTFFSIALASNLLLCSCTPIWSVKLESIEPVTGIKVNVVDKRLPEQKTFRLVDFAKLSYKSYLGDSNTTPDRIAIFESKLNRNLATNLAGSKVEVSQFDILSDKSGSACKGCALAAVSYTAAIVATAGRQPGDDAFTCSLAASLNGSPHFAEVLVPYRVGPFDGMDSEPVKNALQKCISEVIDRWVALVR